MMPAPYITPDTPLGNLAEYWLELRCCGGRMVEIARLGRSRAPVPSSARATVLCMCRTVIPRSQSAIDPWCRAVYPQQRTRTPIADAD
jgi:hypothetical protein